MDGSAFRLRLPSAGHAWVHDAGTDRRVGEVRRGSVNYRPRPGQTDTRVVWFAVPLSRVAHAHPDGCPWFATRRAAAAFVAAGTFRL